MLGYPRGSDPLCDLRGEASLPRTSDEGSGSRESFALHGTGKGAREPAARDPRSHSIDTLKAECERGIFDKLRHREQFNSAVRSTGFEVR